MKTYKDKVFYDIEQRYEEVVVIKAYHPHPYDIRMVNIRVLRMGINDSYMDLSLSAFKKDLYNLYHGYKHKLNVTNGHTYRKRSVPAEIQNLGPTYRHVNTGWRWII